MLLQSLPGLTEAELQDWLESALSDNRHVLAGGYQGKVLLYEGQGYKLVIKVPPKSLLMRWFYIRMLRHEYEVYRKLDGITGIPRCFGLLKNGCLVLEYINGAPLRDKQTQNRERFFDALKALLLAIHARGVAHVDLKKKDNILVTDTDQPCVIDFGVAILQKPGWRPINAWLFATGKKFDLNAWLKHKYRKRYDQITEADRIYLNRTWVESLAGKVKRAYRAIPGLKRRKRRR